MVYITHVKYISFRLPLPLLGGIFMKNLSKNNGFTLIELMIVVAFLGILASIVLPAYKEFELREAAKAAKEATYDREGARSAELVASFYMKENLPAADVISSECELTPLADSYFACETLIVNERDNEETFKLECLSSNQSTSLKTSCRKPL